MNQPKVAGSLKHQVWVEDVYDIDFVRECTPEVLVFPRVANTQRSLIKAMSRDEALFELAPNILLTEPRASQRHLDALTKLVQNTMSYRLDSGRDFERLPQLLGGLLE